MRSIRAHLFLAVALAWIVAPARGQDQGNAQDVKTIVRVYDVRELIQPVPNYPYTGTMSPRQNAALTGSAVASNPFAGASAPPATQPSDVGEQLIQLIEDTVVSDTWRDNGGAVGNIRLLNGSLVVTQSEEAQRQVEELLRQLRGQQGRVVRVRADWVLVDPSQAKTLLPEKTEANAALPEIDPSALEKIPADVPHYRGEIVGFSGQTVHLLASRMRNIVTDLNPIVGQDSVGFDPVQGTVESGAVLQVTASVESDGKSANVDLHSVLSEAGIVGSINFQDIATVATTRPSAVLTTGASVDRIEAVSQEIHSTLRVPLGRPVLIGGMTADPVPAGQTNRRRILILEVDATN